VASVLALKRKGSDLIESAGIYIMNRIERDTKLALSVGLFAWERAVRDAGRALPASGQSGAAVGRAMRKAVRQLGSSSSFDEMQALEREQQQKRRLEDVENLYEEFNTPMDEIRSVTQSIRDILSGDSTSSSASSGVRRLRTVSAAGLGTKNAERQRRAFNRRKKTKLRQEKEFLNVGRTAGSLIDTGFELKRELRAESSLPGYRSEKARKAIAAGAAQTARVLEAAKRDGWSRALFGTAEVRDETIREMVGSTDIEEVESVATDETISQLLEEEYLIVDRIQLCIDDPAETWLTPESLMENEYEIDDDSLREVVTAMICARDDLEVDGERTAVNEDLTLEEMIDRMRVVKNTVDMIVSLAASSVSFTAGENLRNVLYGPEARDGKGVSLLNLDEIESSVAAAVDAVEEAKYFVEEVPTKRKRSIFEILFEEKPTESGLDDDISNEGVTNDKISSSDPPHQWDSTAVAKVVVDSTEPSFWAGAAASRPRFPEVIVSDFEKVGHATESQSGSESEDVGVRLTTAEVVSDEDFDRAVNWAKATTTLPEDGGETEEKKEDSLFTMALLRSLDVVLFVAEKVLLVRPARYPVPFSAGKTSKFLPPLPPRFSPGRPHRRSDGNGCSPASGSSRPGWIGLLWLEEDEECSKRRQAILSCLSKN
jgi:hypothetical protein